MGTRDKRTARAAGTCPLRRRESRRPGGFSFPLDAHATDAGPMLHTSFVTMAATRRALAMTVRAGPTPSEVGRKLASTTNTFGWPYIRQSASRTAWAGYCRTAVCRTGEPRVRWRETILTDRTTPQPCEDPAHQPPELAATLLVVRAELVLELGRTVAPYHHAVEWVRQVFHDSRERQHAPPK